MSQHRKDRHRNGHGAVSRPRRPLHLARVVRNLLPRNVQDRGAHPGLPQVHRRPHQGRERNNGGRGRRDPDRPECHGQRQAGQADHQDDRHGGRLRHGQQDDRRHDQGACHGWRHHLHRQVVGQDHQARPVVRPVPRLRRDGCRHQVPAVPRRRASKAQGGGPHRYPARD